MGFGMRWNGRAAHLQRYVKRDAAILQRFALSSSQMKVVCNKCFDVHVDSAEFPQDLRPRCGAAGRISCSRKLDEGAANRAANVSFNKGEVVVIDQHCASKQPNRCSGIE